MRKPDHFCTQGHKGINYALDRTGCGKQRWERAKNKQSFEIAKIMEKTLEGKQGKQKQ